MAMLEDVLSDVPEHVMVRRMLDDILVKLTLEQVVDQERPVVEGHDAPDTPSEPGLGDQAESYRINLPDHEEMNSSYAFNYVADAVTANDAATIAACTGIEAGKAGIYDAAVASIESARAAVVDGDIYASYRQPVEVQERTETFKRLYPEKWRMLYDCPWLTSTLHVA